MTTYRAQTQHLLDLKFVRSIVPFWRATSLLTTRSFPEMFCPPRRLRRMSFWHATSPYVMAWTGVEESRESEQMTLEFGEP